MTEKKEKESCQILSLKVDDKEALEYVGNEMRDYDKPYVEFDVNKKEILLHKLFYQIYNVIEPLYFDLREDEKSPVKKIRLLKLERSEAHPKKIVLIMEKDVIAKTSISELKQAINSGKALACSHAN